MNKSNQICVGDKVITPGGSKGKVIEYIVLGGKIKACVEIAPQIYRHYEKHELKKENAK